MPTASKADEDTFEIPIEGYKPKYRYIQPTETHNPIEEVAIPQTEPTPPAAEQIVIPDTTNPDSSTEEQERGQNGNRRVGLGKHYTSDNRYVEFLNDFVPLYEKVLTARGINPEYARYLAIQDMLETAGGKSFAGDYNYGNITALPGQSYNLGGDKDVNGKKIQQHFRNYDSLDHYLNEKIKMFTQGRYRNVFNGNVADIYKRIQEAGYVGIADNVRKDYKRYATPLEQLYEKYKGVYIS